MLKCYDFCFSISVNINTNCFFFRFLAIPKQLFYRYSCMTFPYVRRYTLNQLQLMILINISIMA